MATKKKDWLPPITHYGPRFEQCKREALQNLMRKVAPRYQQKRKGDSA